MLIVPQRIFFQLHWSALHALHIICSLNQFFTDPGSELFNTVLDMLATLIHSTLMSDAPSESREENRRHYYNLVKKIKKVKPSIYCFPWQKCCFYILKLMAAFVNLCLRRLAAYFKQFGLSLKSWCQVLYQFPIYALECNLILWRMFSEILA